MFIIVTSELPPIVSVIVNDVAPSACCSFVTRYDIVIVSPSNGSALITPSPKYTSNCPWSFSCTYHTLLSLSTPLISSDFDHADEPPPVDCTVTVTLDVSTSSSVSGNL